VDPLDAAILRTWFRTGQWAPEGIDPRRSTADLARALGAEPRTVSRRVRQWSEAGFLAGMSILPNPAYFGVELTAQAVGLEDLARREEFEEEVAHLEGPCLVHRLGAGYGLVYLHADAAAAERDRHHLGRLDGVHPLGGPFPVPMPPPEYVMRRRDWELLSALRRTGTPFIARAWTRLGLGRRAWHQRLSAWIDGNAVFFTPSLDFSRTRGTVIWVGGVVEPGALADVEAATHRIWKEFVPVRGLFPLETLLPGRAPRDPLPSIQLLIPSRSAQSAEAEFLRFSPAYPGSYRPCTVFRHGIGSPPMPWTPSCTVPSRARSGAFRPPRGALLSRAARALPPERSPSSPASRWRARPVGSRRVRLSSAYEALAQAHPRSTARSKVTPFALKQPPARRGDRQRGVFGPRSGTELLVRPFRGSEMKAPERHRDERGG
jgi:DNA-binding Lrp family transcriptional regulator